jgi:ABC-type transport system involved in Fe-S cluster assembly fused permease/ATPase subunit
LDLVLGNGEGASEVDIPELINLDLDAAKFAIRGRHNDWHHHVRRLHYRFYQRNSGIAIANEDPIR